ncbi:MAG: hypothetical protein PHQ18_05040 [Patescibacteria group bacterium]|nr:hypothetical protein [Patescibacteria group bacterium]
MSEKANSQGTQDGIRDFTGAGGDATKKPLEKIVVQSGFAGDESFVRSKEILAEAAMRSETLADILVSGIAYEAQKKQAAEKEEERLKEKARLRKQREKKEEERKEKALLDIKDTLDGLAKEERSKRKAVLIQNSSPESDDSK